MRTSLAFFSLLLIPFLARAQDDPAAHAAQAAEQAQQAALQAMHDAQEANRQAAEAAQQAAQNAQNADNDIPAGPCCVSWTAAPKFSVKAGKYNTPVTVKMTDATRGAVIYYSTDGWTPTVNSPRYRGPIAIQSTTNLQAIAIAPYSVRSVVTSAQYTISGNSASSSTLPATIDNLVSVPLAFDSEVTSKTAEVGDKIPMVLTHDVQIGQLLVNRGTPATVTITQVDHTSVGGAPGSLSFEADDLRPASGPIPLQGGATREGEAKIPNAAILIPMVGPFTALRHGTDAVITKGTPFVAYVNLGMPTAAAK